MYIKILKRKLKVDASNEKKGNEDLKRRISETLRENNCLL